MFESADFKGFRGFIVTRNCLPHWRLSCEVATNMQWLTPISRLIVPPPVRNFTMAIELRGFRWIAVNTEGL